MVFPTSVLCGDGHRVPLYTEYTQCQDVGDGGVTPGSHLVSTSGCRPGVLEIKEPPLPRVQHQGPEEEEGAMRIRGGTADGARGGLREGAGDGGV